MLSHVKMAEPTQMQFGMESGASKHVLHRHVDAPTGRGTYLGVPCRLKIIVKHRIFGMR